MCTKNDDTCKFDYLSASLKDNLKISPMSLINLEFAYMRKMSYGTKT